MNTRRELKPLEPKKPTLPVWVAYLIWSLVGCGGIYLLWVWLSNGLHFARLGGG